MSMSTHTPGPWMVQMKRTDKGVTSYIVFQHDRTAVSVAHDGSYWPADYCPWVDDDGYAVPDESMDCSAHRVANARLIAAAPELLEALEFLANAARATTGFASPMALAEADKALAKAKGGAS